MINQPLPPFPQEDPSSHIPEHVGERWIIRKTDRQWPSPPHHLPSLLLLWTSGSESLGPPNSWIRHNAVGNYSTWISRFCFDLWILKHSSTFNVYRPGRYPDPNVDTWNRQTSLFSISRNSRKVAFSHHHLPPGHPCLFLLLCFLFIMETAWWMWL